MRHANNALAVVVIGSLLAGSRLLYSAPQTAGETFTATASLITPAGARATAPVTVHVTRQTTDAERATVVDALKKSGTAGVAQAIKPMPEAGYIELGGRRTPVNYAYMRPMSGGRLLTVIAPAPILYLAAGMPEAPPKAGFDLAMAVLGITNTGSGYGELVPAGKVSLDDAGGIHTEDYGGTVVMLIDVQVKK